MKNLYTLIALSLATSNVCAAEDTSSTMYRNGGHYGLTNSDVQLEIAGAPSEPAYRASEPVQTVAWEGTLYRNGGHYGTDNSDIKLPSAE